MIFNLFFAGVRFVVLDEYIVAKLVTEMAGGELCQYYPLGESVEHAPEACVVVNER